MVARLPLQTKFLHTLAEMAQKFVDDTIAGSKVVVFSKSNCPHSAKAKQILTKANAPFTVIELDERMRAFKAEFKQITKAAQLYLLGDCSELQDYLLSLTGARSVPRVFIGQKFIGGATETKALMDQGKLVSMLEDAGAL